MKSPLTFAILAVTFALGIYILKFGFQKIKVFFEKPLYQFQLKESENAIALSAGKFAIWHSGKFAQINRLRDYEIKIFNETTQQEIAINRIWFGMKYNNGRQYNYKRFWFTAAAANHIFTIKKINLAASETQQSILIKNNHSVFKQVLPILLMLFGGMLLMGSFVLSILVLSGTKPI